MTHAARLLTAILVGAVLIATADLQAREMYRWTDENGVVHFSDQKPPGQQDFQTQTVPDDPQPQADNPYAAPVAAEQPSVAQQRREDIAQQKRQAREEKAERDAQCAAWRAEVERLEPNRRVFFTNEEGETERMDDVERVERVASLKDQIAQHCN